MENVRKRLSCADAKEMDMVDYISSIGYEPTKQKGDNYWYSSPLHNENTPSFKIDRKLNRWFDYGEGRGGNLVDFGVAFHRCTVTEFLDKLNGNLSLPKKSGILLSIIYVANGFPVLHASALG
jgi:hypothetical protein